MSALQVLLRALIAVVIVTILGFAMGSFQVAGNESAVLTRFGSPVRTLTEPGAQLARVLGAYGKRAAA